MKRGLLALLVCCGMSLSACVSMPANDFEHFAITINGGGDILSPTVAEKKTPSESEANGFMVLPAKEVGKYIDELFNAVEASQHREHLLIFVHGGLNSLPTSTERVNEWISNYKRGKEGLDSYYPILINWDSGFFESYGDYLFTIRQGEQTWWAAPTSPLYFGADAGRLIARAPIDILYTSYRDMETIPLIENGTNKFRLNSNLIYAELKTKYPGNISLGRDLPWGVQTFYKVPWNIVTWPFQLITSPVVDGFGSPAWEGMLRRSKVLFNNPKEFDIQKDRAEVGDAVNGLPHSVMSEFADRLARYMTKYNNADITLIGHSMGAIIINNLLSKYPNIPYKNIVYMAGADSVRNTIDSVIRYMGLPGHECTNFYNLTLHPQNEVEESNVLSFAPRGSLLVWIDDFFSTPHTQFDRTVGRWENMIQAYGEIPERIRARVFIKAFDQDDPQITKHGSFSEASFWQEDFWKPKP